jgi:hypothetical protein
MVQAFVSCAAGVILDAEYAGRGAEGNGQIVVTSNQIDGDARAVFRAQGGQQAFGDRARAAFDDEHTNDFGDAPTEEVAHVRQTPQQ